MDVTGIGVGATVCVFSVVLDSTNHMNELLNYSSLAT